MKSSMLYLFQIMGWKFNCNMQTVRYNRWRKHYNKTKHQYCLSVIVGEGSPLPNVTLRKIMAIKKPPPKNLKTRNFGGGYYLYQYK